MDGKGDSVRFSFVWFVFLTMVFGMGGDWGGGSVP